MSGDDQELPESLRAAAAMRTCGDPDCDDPRHLKKEYKGVLDLSDDEVDAFIGTLLGLRSGTDLRARITQALDESVVQCARCEVCDKQVDAVMEVLGYG